MSIFPVKSLKFIILDITIAVNAVILAFFSFNYTHFLSGFNDFPLLFFPVFISVYLVIFSFFRLYRTLWEYINFDDLIKLAFAGLSSYLVMILLNYFSGSMIKSPFLLTVNLLTVILMIFARIVFRFSFIKKERGSVGHSSNIVIVGAGEAARNILSDIRKRGMIGDVICLLDDNKEYHGMSIYGKRVVGSLGDLSAVCSANNIDEIIVSIEQITADKLAQMIDSIDIKKTKIRIIPASGELLDDKVSLKQTRKIFAEDLLGRSSVELNTSMIKSAFAGKVVLVTGAGGSIGSEICHQFLSYPINRLVCLSRSEYSLYKLKEKLSQEKRTDIKIKYYLGNIRDIDRLNEIMSAESPDTVFHAAAHKHVPYMEENEKEAIKNNVLGTENILKSASLNGVKKFIMVSTDKAVNPTNVMGASKRAAELLTSYYNSQSNLNTAIVRFGNVLGSRGSVVPLFRKQILSGGPITVTHPDVVRFFMTISEAAQLTINCGAMANGGERFILDMGKAIKIDQLVRRMARLYGFHPGRDIEIKYTGLRPGEKIYEELMTSDESLKATNNKKIFVCLDDTLDVVNLKNWLDEIKNDLLKMTGLDVRRMLHRLVPEYQEYKNEKQ